MLLVVSAAGSDCSCNTSSVWSALAALYESMNGAAWVRRDNWLIKETTVCEWYGFTDCVVLSLRSNGLHGTLPAELYEVTSLVTVRLDSNQIFGSLPPQYSQLTRLSHFNVSNCSLVGSLPPEYGSLSNMTVFHAALNNISGTLPASYAGWRNLQVFDVSQNNITGSLPREYAALTSLIIFCVENNRITGTLPAAYQSWLALAVFSVIRNNIEGTLPPEYGAMQHLVEFTASHNQISGNIPEAYSHWTRLSRFRISNCFLEGSLHPALQSWTSIVSLNLNANRLNGTLPSTYGAWTNVVNVHLYHNELAGTLPHEYASWKNLAYFRLHNNKITGSIPSSYARWTQLIQFEVYENHLEGAFPIEYSSWGSTIISFSVSYNKFLSSIPPSYANWSNLQILAVSYNHLSGPLPSFLGTMRHLQVAGLNDNNFSGRVPSEWTALLSLASCTLHNNPNLIGTFPTRMPYAVVVSVCNTSLCGAVPAMWKLPPPLTTYFVCANLNQETLFSFLSNASAVETFPPSLPSCDAPSLPTPSSIVAPATAAQEPSTASSAVVAATVGLTAALSGAGLPRFGAGALQVAVHARSALIHCSQTDKGPTVEPIGVSVADNPTRVALPGRLSYTGGSVVGNILLFVSLPMAVTAMHKGKAAILRKRVPWNPEMYVVTPFLGVFSGLCVPTAAASVQLLLLSVGSSSDDTPTAAAVGFFGALFVALPVIIITLAVVWTRASIRGCRVPVAPRRNASRQKNSFGGAETLLVRVSILMFRERFWWDFKLVKQRTWIVAVLRPLLDGVCDPYRWVILWDLTVMILQGTLIGFGSMPDASCDSKSTAGWGLLAVCLISFIVAVALRCRQTLLDTCIDVATNLWTAATVLLACLDVDESTSEAMAAAQAVMQVCWSLPFAVRWLVRRCRSASASESPPIDRGALVVNKARGQQLEALRALLDMIASSQHSTGFVVL